MNILKNLIIILSFLISFNVYSNTISGAGKIVYVYDGDTFKIEVPKVKINELINRNFVSPEKTENYTFIARIANINTPEKETRKGDYIKKLSIKKFNNATVKFECYEKGYYGRAICSIETFEGDIGEFMIRKGFSDYITKYGKHPTQHNTYKNIK